tara:strand:- start:555 stop:1352 length:798 start_codon:yes stop_codon:yes gene_type:complete
MALQSSGAISLNEIHIEAGGSSGTQVSMNDSDVRALIGSTASTAVSFSDYYGASADAEFVGFAKVVDTTTDSSNYTGSAQNLSIQNGDLLVMAYTARQGNSGNNVGQFQMFSSANGGGSQTNISGSTAVKEHGGTVSGIIYATSNGSYSSMKAKISASSNFNAMLLFAGVFRNAGSNSPDRTFTGGNGGTNQSITLSSLSPPGVIIAIGGRSTTSSSTVTFSGLDSYINDNNSQAGGAAGYKLNTATSFSGSCNYAWSISAAHFT